MTDTNNGTVTPLRPLHNVGDRVPITDKGAIAKLQNVQERLRSAREALGIERERAIQTELSLVKAIQNVNAQAHAICNEVAKDMHLSFDPITEITEDGSTKVVDQNDWTLDWANLHFVKTGC
jgi:hypothetical protein